MHATQSGRTIGPLGGVELVQDATQLILPSSIDLLDDGAPPRRRFQGDDAAIESIRASPEVPGSEQTIREAGDRRRGHTQRSRRLTRTHCALLAQHHQQPQLRQRDLDVASLDAAQRHTHEISGGDLECSQILGTRAHRLVATVAFAHSSSIAKAKPCTMQEVA